MKLRLLRRRQVWLPTIWGWLLLLLLAAVGCVVVARNIHSFLAPIDPAPGASILVVEGWLDDDDLGEALAVFKKGRYEQVITTGGPIDKHFAMLGAMTYAELSARYLTEQGVPASRIRAIPAPETAQDRTFISAVMVRDYLKSERLTVSAIDLFSADTHTRRSRMLYRMALGPHVTVGAFSSRDKMYDAEHWWRYSAGISAVVGQGSRLLWTACCFYPPPAGSHEERWGQH